MSDSIHDALSAFRDTMLMSVAKLEFQLRDTLSKTRIQNPTHCYTQSPLDLNMDHMSNLSEIHMDTSLNEKLVQSLQDIATRMCSLESQIQTIQSSPQTVSSKQRTFADQIEHELMTIESQQNTRNILVSSVRSTPALSAAVAAANPPSFDLIDNEEEEETIEVKDEEDAVDEEDEEVEVVEVEDEEVEVVEVEDEEVEVVEVEDEEVEVVEVEDEEDAVDEDAVDEDAVDEDAVEEEAVEVEEFMYKGQTYQRDAENNVYLEGTPVGTWNGKKIIPL